MQQLSEAVQAPGSYLVQALQMAPETASSVELRSLTTAGKKILDFCGFKLPG